MQTKQKAKNVIATQTQLQEIESIIIKKYKNEFLSN